MQFQFDVSTNAVPAPVGANSTEAMTQQMILGVLQQMLDVQKQAFQEMLNVQREHLNHMRALQADAINRWRTVLGRWESHYPELPGNCKKVYPLMEKAYLSLLDNLSQELVDEGDGALDSDFALQEFIDKNGQRLGQFGQILSVIGPISEVGSQQQQNETKGS